MTPIQVSRSSESPIDLEKVKRALRLLPDESDDDGMIDDLISGETRRYEDFTRRVIVKATFRFQCQGWFTRAVIDLHPIRSVIGVFYLDPDMHQVALAPADYRLVPRSHGAYLGIRSDWPGPALADVEFPVWFDIIAGVDLPGDTPAIYPVDDADSANIIHMVKQIFDHDDPLPEEQLRRRFSGRRLLW